MRQSGALKPCWRGHWRWSLDGEVVSSITVRTSEDALRLTYKVQMSGGRWRSVEEQARLLWTAPNYGGRRAWFACPGCGARRGVLYGGPCFRCRGCLRAVYDSQYYCPISRLVARSDRIRRKLGAAYRVDVVEKPKGMH